jgi:hypothetical protein
LSLKADTLEGIKSGSLAGRLEVLEDKGDKNSVAARFWSGAAGKLASKSDIETEEIEEKN